MSTSRDDAAKIQRLFDVRTIERNIKKGLTTRKDYEKHLKTLSDATEKVAPPEEHPDEVADDDALDERAQGLSPERPQGNSQGTSPGTSHDGPADADQNDPSEGR